MKYKNVLVYGVLCVGFFTIFFLFLRTNAQLTNEINNLQRRLHAIDRCLDSLESNNAMHFYDEDDIDWILSLFQHRHDVEELGFEQTRLSLNSIALMAKMPKLRKIALMGRCLSPEDFGELWLCKQLEEIDLYFTDYSEEATNKLEMQLPNCKIIRRDRQ